MFEGFSPETIDFLWGIRFNNNKTWFEANKQTYLDKLYRPMKELAAAVFEPFSAIDGMICKVSRIYRDARLPHYAEAPYKNTLWLCIRRENDSWSQNPALFFEIAPEGYTFGFGLIRPRADTMAALRSELAANPGPFLDMIRKIERETDVTVRGEAYYRKKPCPVPEIERFYNLKNIEAYRQYPPDTRLFSPSLADDVRRTLTALLPLNEYLLRFTHQP